MYSLVKEQATFIACGDALTSAERGDDFSRRSDRVQFRRQSTRSNPSTFVRARLAGLPYCAGWASELAGGMK